eukprot:1245156-Rhodomonas_salina.1
MLVPASHSSVVNKIPGNRQGPLRAHPAILFMCSNYHSGNLAGPMARKQTRFSLSPKCKQTIAHRTGRGKPATSIALRQPAHRQVVSEVSCHSQQALIYVLQMDSEVEREMDEWRDPRKGGVHCLAGLRGRDGSQQALSLLFIAFAGAVGTLASYKNPHLTFFHTSMRPLGTG